MGAGRCRATMPAAVPRSFSLSDRRTLRMVARSTSSWLSAPAPAGTSPTAATAINPTLSAIPIQML